VTQPVEQHALDLLMTGCDFDQASVLAFNIPWQISGSSEGLPASSKPHSSL
jgi:hypothetical protein